MVEIIPKPARQEFSWERAIMYLVVGLLVVSIGAMFVLNHFIAESEIKMEELEQILAGKKTKEEDELEAEVLGYKTKIEDFAEIFKSHPYPSQIFEFIEGFCHPKVWFLEMTLGVDKNNLFLSGETTDFLSLEQQMLVLRQEPLIEGIALSNLAVSETGTVTFDFNITLKPAVLR